MDRGPNIVSAHVVSHSLRVCRKRDSVRFTFPQPSGPKHYSDWVVMIGTR